MIKVIECVVQFDRFSLPPDKNVLFLVSLFQGPPTPNTSQTQSSSTSQPQKTSNADNVREDISTVDGGHHIQTGGSDIAGNRAAGTDDAVPPIPKIEHPG